MCPLSVEERAALRAGTLRLECEEIAIKAANPARDVTFQGPGTIAIGTSGEIEFEVHADPRLPPGGWVSGPGGGRLVFPHELPALSARDQIGRLWTGSANLGSLPISGEGTLQTLAWSEPPAEGDNWLWLHFPFPAESSPPWPGSRVWEFEGGDFLFRFQTMPGGFDVVCIGGEQPLPKGLDSRIEESLWLTMGALVGWTGQERSTIEGRTTLLHQRFFRGTPARCGCPLFSPREHLPDLGRLFHGYLEYVLATGAPERYHPTSGDLRLVLSASATTIELEALASTVAIEGFLHREHSREGCPTPESVAAAEQLLEAVRSWEGDSTVRNRALGMLGGLKDANPTARLRALEGRGILSSEERETWQKLRNWATHGRTQEQEPLVTLAKLEQVNHLLFTLVLDRLGYRGMMRDRTIDGWPLRHFPTPPPE